jgi:hypothetical protein
MIMGTILTSAKQEGAKCPQDFAAMNIDEPTLRKILNKLATEGK